MMNQKRIVANLTATTRRKKNGTRRITEKHLGGGDNTLCKNCPKLKRKFTHKNFCLY